jgi:TolB protein
VPLWLKTGFHIGIGCLFWVFIFPLIAEAKVYIDISAPAAERLPIAIPELYSSNAETAKVALKITEVITRDLEVSGILNILDKATYPDDPLRAELASEKIDFKPWANIGAEGLLKGIVSMEGGKVTVDARLYDVAMGRQVMASRYAKDAKEVRRIAHIIADDIISVLTGERGVFSTRMAFVSNVTGNKEVYVMDYDGEGVEALTKNGSINLSPSWSPDGTAISYVSFKSGRPLVYVRGVGNGKESIFSFQEGSVMGASWSPDGKRLALVISREGNADIYAINRDGSGITRLTDSWGLDVSPSWSPNGREISFVSDRGGSPQIYMMDSTGKNVRRLTFEGSYNTSPSWSPKGDRIAFAGMRDGRFEVFTINPDGSDLKQLTADAGNNENPTWSPDGRFISFSSTRDGGSSIFIMHSDGSGQRRVTSMKGKATSPSWGPRVEEP